MARSPYDTDIYGGVTEEEWPNCAPKPSDPDYYDKMFSMSGAERIAVSLALRDIQVDKMRRSISYEHPELSDIEIGYRVAERLYADEPETLKLIQAMREQSA